MFLPRTYGQTVKTTKTVIGPDRSNSLYTRRFPLKRLTFAAGDGLGHKSWTMRLQPFDTQRAVMRTLPSEFTRGERWGAYVDKVPGEKHRVRGSTIGFARASVESYSGGAGQHQR